MATWYANSFTGASGNAGTSMALAKATLAQCNTAASAGDTIICTGIFREALPASKQLFWRGDGYCEFNGNGNVGNTHSTAPNTYYDNITFTNFSTAPIGGTGLGGIVVCRNCIFRNMPSAMFTSLAYMKAENCQFYNLTSYAILNSLGGTTLLFESINCVYYNNSVDIWSSNGGSDVGLQRNVFGSAIMLRTSSATLFYCASYLSGNNVFDFTNGKCQISTSTDKTTLAAWLTSVGNNIQELNSITRVWTSDVTDYTTNGFNSTPAGYLLTAAQLSTPIGLSLPAVGISNNANSSLWTGAVLTNTNIDSFGNIVLEAGSTSGTAAFDVIDYGASVSLQRVVFNISGENYPIMYMDTDTADSPGYFTFEIRGSAGSFTKTDGTIPWIIMPRRGEVGSYVTTNKFRYWQIRVTLRSI